MSFFTILPCVKEELVLIDHSYGSMYAALGKYGLIEQKTAKEARELLANYKSGYYDDFLYASNYRDSYRTAKRAEPKPDEIHEAFALANKGLTTERGKVRIGRMSSMGSIWRDISHEDVTKFKRNRRKVTFLHGDIADLANLGPFDLVYLSNALEYKGRNGNDFKLDKIVKPGGYVAHCFSKPSYRGDVTKLTSGWKVVKQVTPDYRRGDTYGVSWVYTLCQVPA